MAKRKMRKMKKKNKNSLMAIAFLICSIILIYGISKNIARVYSENKTYETLVAEKETLESEIKDLKEDVKNSEDEDYIIRSARNRYGFTESGEEVVKLPKE